jgi:hypothetical protein
VYVNIYGESMHTYRYIYGSHPCQNIFSYESSTIDPSNKLKKYI